MMTRSLPITFPSPEMDSDYRRFCEITQELMALAIEADMRSAESEHRATWSELHDRIASVYGPSLAALPADEAEAYVQPAALVAMERATNRTR